MEFIHRNIFSKIGWQCNNWRRPSKKYSLFFTHGKYTQNIDRARFIYSVTSQAACTQGGLAPIDLQSDRLKVTIGKEDHIFHYVWLRDNCKCPSCKDMDSGQKYHTSSSIQLDVSPEFAKLNENGNSLHVIWKNDMHVSQYDFSWLQKHSYSSTSLKSRLLQHHSEIDMWGFTDLHNDFPSLDYAAFMLDRNSFRLAVSHLYKKGIVFLKNTPSEPDTISMIATRLAPIRESFYGRIWDVVSSPIATNIAYTSRYLGLHQDLLYFESPPGIQLLHCIKNNAKGGESLYADGFKAAHLLKVLYPAQYDLLKRVPITFEYSRAGEHNLVFRHPTIEIDDFLSCENHETIKSIFYSPPFQGPFDAIPEKLMISVYQALKSFENILISQDVTFKRRAQAGDMVLFDNRRILHGREAFDSHSGERHLRGTYIDRDEVWDKYRIARDGT